MAVTRADLEPSRRRWRTAAAPDLGSKTGVLLMVISILFGLFCFVLCLIAEATRSQINWASSDSGKDETYECTYSGSGKVPLICAAGAFLALTLAMVVEHTYMLLVMSKSTPPALVTWDNPHSNPLNSLTWQAGFFFVSTWICFAVGEILLLIGLSIESGHLKNWSTPSPSCLIIRQGLFTTAGVIGLVTVFLASGLYITALRAQWMIQDRENVHHEVLETSALHSSPPRSPRYRVVALSNENPVVGQNLNDEPELCTYLSAFDKHLNLV